MDKLYCTNCGSEDVEWLDKVKDDPRQVCRSCGFVTVPRFLVWGKPPMWAPPICPFCGSAYVIGVKYRNWKRGLPVRYFCLKCKRLFIRRKKWKQEWLAYVDGVTFSAVRRREWKAFLEQAKILEVDR